MRPPLPITIRILLWLLCAEVTLNHPVESLPFRKLLSLHFGEYLTLTKEENVRTL